MVRASTVLDHGDRALAVVADARATLAPPLESAGSAAGGRNRVAADQLSAAMQGEALAAG